MASFPSLAEIPARLTAAEYPFDPGPETSKAAWSRQLLVQATLAACSELLQEPAKMLVEI